MQLEAIGISIGQHGISVKMTRGRPLHTILDGVCM